MTHKNAVYSKLSILTVTAHAMSMIGKKEVKLEVRKKESKNSFVCFVVNFGGVWNKLLFCCCSGKLYRYTMAKWGWIWLLLHDLDCGSRYGKTRTDSLLFVYSDCHVRVIQSVGNRTMLNTCRVREPLEVRVVPDERGSINEIVWKQSHLKANCIMKNKQNIKILLKQFVNINFYDIIDSLLLLAELVLLWERVEFLDELLLSGQTVHGMIRLSLWSDIAWEGNWGVGTSVDTVVVEVTDVDLHWSVIIGSNDTVGGRAKWINQIWSMDEWMFVDCKLYEVK